MADVVGSSIGQEDAKWPEWRCMHRFPEVIWRHSTVPLLMPRQRCRILPIAPRMSTTMPASDSETKSRVQRTPPVVKRYQKPMDHPMASLLQRAKEMFGSKPESNGHAPFSIRCPQ